MTYHAGERWVQQQAGVREEAEGLTKIISTTLNKKAQKFLQEQCFAIASTVDSQGWVWASLLLEKPGFIKIIGDRKIAIPILSVQDHLLRQNLVLHQLDFDSGEKNEKLEINPDVQCRKNILLTLLPRNEKNCIS
jgi:hypothetical protein